MNCHHMESSTTCLKEAKGIWYGLLRNALAGICLKACKRATKEANKQSRLSVVMGHGGM